MGGGPYPLPQRRGCPWAPWVPSWGKRPWVTSRFRVPLGAMGAMGTIPLGVGPRGPWPPFAGGGDTLARGLAGVEIFYLGVPHSDPPRMAPLILGVSLVIRYRFLPIFTSHIVD